MTSVTKDNAVGEEYRYDGVGRRSYEMNAARGIDGWSLTYSDEDHLLTAGETSYQYDLDGFLTTKTDASGTMAYSYSSRGELLKATLPDGKKVEYVHDPQGRRIAKKVNGVVTEKYLWQGLTRLLAVYNGSNALAARFQYADSRMPVTMTKGSTTYYLGYDQVGSLRLVTDSAGNTVKQVDYDSFGNILTDSNPAFTIPFGFAGGLHDRDINLVRFGFRDYDPETGRWTAKDPIGFKGGDVNLWGYVQADPVNWVDPSGQGPESILVVGALLLIPPMIAAIDNTIKAAQTWHANENNVAEGATCEAPSPSSWPGDDPTIAPPGTVWKGKPGSEPGDNDGNYHNPGTKESYRPDLEHDEPIGPHWDYKDPNGKWNRIYPDGRVEPK